jgi:threonine dehydratase
VSREPLSREDVVRAAETIRRRVRRTPLLDGADVAAGLRLKAELFQHTGSFKARGVTNRLAAMSAEERSRGVAGASAGNHAIALAWGAAREGVECVVYSWAAASPFKLDRARALGARIDVEAEDPAGAFARLEEHLATTGATLVHPFDDPLVMAGQGTVGVEILEDAPEADVVLVQVGGGGLVSGIATAVKGMRPDARVIAVEPERSPALHEGIKAGKVVHVEAESEADGLNGPYAGENCIAVCSMLGVESVLVSEAALKEAFRFMYGRMKLACELAGAATAAALLSGKVDLEPGQTVAAVVSGGNVAAKTAAAILVSEPE